MRKSKMSVTALSFSITFLSLPLPPLLSFYLFIYASLYAYFLLFIPILLSLSLSIPTSHSLSLFRSLLLTLFSLYPI